MKTIHADKPRIRDDLWEVRSDFSAVQLVPLRILYRFSTMYDVSGFNKVGKIVPVNRWTTLRRSRLDAFYVRFFLATDWAAYHVVQ